MPLPICLLLTLVILLPQSTVDIRFQTTDRAEFRVIGWGDAARFNDRWTEILNVYVDSNANITDIPPVSGQRLMSGNDLVFVPRYPLGAGLRYRVVLRIPGREMMTRTFETPKADLTPTTVVDRIYPSAGVLPENQLKFYIHFSAAMSRGEAYRRIQLLDESGNPVLMPFLELEQELWDQPAQRLTLFFDPGRIKRDILPNQQMGPPIVEGRKYTLVISKEWRDAAGKQLKDDVRKSFSVVRADRQPLDLKSWKIIPPQAATSAALLADFPEPLDHALMMRQFEVVDATGNVVEGVIQSDRDETRLQFTPNTPWKAGRYELRVGTNVADLAGNMLDRPFEIDVFDTVTTTITRETRTMPFTVK